MTHKIIINDQQKLNWQQKHQQAAAALNGRLVSDLKTAELSALVEVLAMQLDLLDEQNRIVIPQESTLRGGLPGVV